MTYRVSIEPPSAADAALAVQTIKAVLPIVRRYPSLRNDGGTTGAALQRVRLAMVPLFGAATLAGAIEAHLSIWRFLNSEHGDKPAEDTAQDAAIYAAWRLLGEFAKQAPASGPDDAAARARFLAWNNATGGVLAEDDWQASMEAVASDFTRLATGAPIPSEATFAGWCRHG